MDIELVKVEISDKQIIKKLLEEYFSELGDPHEYKYLDLYWQQKTRHPFLVKVDNNIAGFVLVNENDPQSIPNYPLGIAEFYIAREYRNKGVGENIAIQVFKMFKGKWSIRETLNNLSGVEFWRKVIESYTKGNYQEIKSDDNRWKGYTQIFEST